VRKFLVELKNVSVWRPPARRALLVLALAMALPVGAGAGPAPRVASPNQRIAPLPPDRSTPLSPRRADAARLRELAGQREFRYEKPEASTSAWDAFWARLWRWLSRLRGTRSGTGSPAWQFISRYGFYAVALGLLVFAALKLLQVDITAAFGRSARRGQMTYDTAAENIHEVDFRARIAEAEEAGNFRLATRLGYLELLKHLTDRGLIQWQPEKTNHAYLAELAAGPLREAFRGATRQFEYVWYGDLRLNAALYQQARASQRMVTAQLDGGRGSVAGAAAFPNALHA
jgi:hypothetical protein